MRAQFPLIALAVVGCSGGGKLVPKDIEPATATGSQGGPPAPGVAAPGATAPLDPNAPLDARVTFEEGRKETYVLTNEMVSQSRGMAEGPLVTTESFLNAKQEVTVMKGGTVRIRTFEARGAAEGDEPEQKQADTMVKNLAKSVEGSVLQGEFDSRGRGKNLFLLGDGIGLNPMGPQAGAQEVLLGFMGVLLPEKPVRPGDTWTGTYDITTSAQDLFGNAGAMVDNGEVPITYELIEFDPQYNRITVGITSRGKPTVKIPIGGGIAKIEMTVESKGQALVRLNDGWLQELRLETTIVTAGFVATKQVVKTVTRRQK